MAGVIKKYRLGKNPLSRALLDGFSLEDGGVLTATEDSLSVRHVFLRGLDGVDNDLEWGRLSLDTAYDGDMLLTIRAFASNDPVFLRKGTLTAFDDFLLDPSIPPETKSQFFGIAGGIENSGVEDMLLYGLKGRYLYLWIEVGGVGKVSLSNLCVFVPGDNFFASFPEVYQTDNDFFRRYLTVFSTMYNDFQDKIDHLDSLLCLDTAPVPWLHCFASWLGLETKGMLSDEATLRKLVKAAPRLFACKGTKTAIQGIVELFVDVPFYIIEKNLLTQQQSAGNMYGSSPYDFSVLINCRADEQLRTCLGFFIDQFKPVRSRYKIVFMGDSNGLDSFTYLDFNGSMLHSSPASFDDGSAITGTTYLK